MAGRAITVLGGYVSQSASQLPSTARQPGQMNSRASQYQSVHRKLLLSSSFAIWMKTPSGRVERSEQTSELCGLSFVCGRAEK